MAGSSLGVKHTITSRSAGTSDRPQANADTYKERARSRCGHYSPPYLRGYIQELIRARGKGERRPRRTETTSDVCFIIESERQPFDQDRQELKTRMRSTAE